MSYLSKLHETVSRFPTDYWNDSCSVEELRYAIEHGAVGATTNPTIVLGVLGKEMPLWNKRIQAMVAGNPAGTRPGSPGAWWRRWRARGPICCCRSSSVRAA